MRHSPCGGVGVLYTPFNDFNPDKELTALLAEDCQPQGGIPGDPLWGGHFYYQWLGATTKVVLPRGEHSRRGPSQDVPYDLNIWYVSKIIYLL